MAEQLLDERSRLALLSSGDIGVRASLGAGYDSLAEAERDTLHVLGELGTSNGPTWAVAAALDVDLASAVVSVERLVESGLVDSEGAGARHRYRLHDLTRLLAHERAVRADPVDVRAERWRRVLERWRQLVSEAVQRLPVLVDVAADLPAVELAPLAPADLADVLREPAAWLAETPSTLLRHVERALDVLPATQVWPALTELWHYWRTADVINDAGPVIGQVHDACLAAGDRHGEAVTLTLDGFDPYRRRDPGAIVERLQRARELFVEVGDRIGEVRALLLLATALVRLAGQGGDGGEVTAREVAAERALAAAREAVEIADGLSLPDLRADALAVLARLALGLGRLDEAESVAEQGRSTRRGGPPPRSGWRSWTGCRAPCFGSVDRSRRPATCSSGRTGSSSASTTGGAWPRSSATWRICSTGPGSPTPQPTCCAPATSTPRRSAWTSSPRRQRSGCDSAAETSTHARTVRVNGRKRGRATITPCCAPSLLTSSSMSPSPPRSSSRSPSPRTTWTPGRSSRLSR
ncbi:hypothetical protein [Salana multivorans]